jgi:DNA-binding CsgD family transcriptional regulator
MRFYPDKRVFNLIGLLYETAGNQSPEAWLDVYKQLTTQFSAGPGGFNFFLSENKEFEIIASTIDPELLNQYRVYYQTVSPFRHLITAMKAGDRFSRARHCSDKDFLKTELYNGFFKKHDVFNYEYQVFFSDARGFAGFSLSRPRGMKNFSRAEIKTIEFLVPHLQNAFQIYLKFAEFERDKLIISECLEKISQNVIVLDKFGKIVFATDSAAKLIAGRDGLSIDHRGVLSANSPQESKKLKLLLQSVFEPARVENVDYAKTIQISRLSGRRPFSVFVSPFYEKSGVLFMRQTFALLFIKEPDDKVESIEPFLSDTYSLTSAESRLAVLLAQGRSINEICEILGVKQNTVRTHLKRVFSKTETTRQSELVKLIINSSIKLKL